MPYIDIAGNPMHRTCPVDLELVMPDDHVPEQPDMPLRLPDHVSADVNSALRMERRDTIMQPLPRHRPD